MGVILNDMEVILEILNFCESFVPIDNGRFRVVTHF